MVLIGVSLSSLAALAVDKLLGGITASSLLIRRFIVVPGALAAAYVAVFQNRPKTNFSDSVLPFLSNPYANGLSPTHLVGEIFVGNTETAANVSLLGHGYFCLLDT